MALGMQTAFAVSPRAGSGQATGMLTSSVASDRLTSDWPSCRQARILDGDPMPAALDQGRVIDDPCSMMQRMSHRSARPDRAPATRAGPSFQLASLTKCWIDWCRRETFQLVATSGDQLHARALTGYQQPSHVVAQPAPARIVAHNRAQILDILLEAPLHRGVETRSFAHAAEIRISQPSAIHQPEY